MNTQKLIELENNLLDYISNGIANGQESASSLVKAYRDLLDVVSVRKSLPFPEDSTKSSEVLDASNSSSGDGQWKLFGSTTPNNQQWVNGGSIINAGSMESTVCISDLLIRLMDERIPNVFTRHIIRVIDGGGTGGLVSQYIITKLPANAEIP